MGKEYRIRFGTSKELGKLTGGFLREEWPYEGNTFSLKSASKDRQVWEEALAGVSSLSVTSCRMVNAALMKASDTATPLCALRAVLATGSGAPLLIIEYVCTTASARNAGLANMMMTFALEDLAKDIHAQVFIVSTDTALPYWMRPDKGFVPAINDPLGDATLEEVYGADDMYHVLVPPTVDQGCQPPLDPEDAASFVLVRPGPSAVTDLVEDGVIGSEADYKGGCKAPGSPEVLFPDLADRPYDPPAGRLTTPIGAAMVAKGLQRCCTAGTKVVSAPLRCCIATAAGLCKTLPAAQGAIHLDSRLLAAGETGITVEEAAAVAGDCPVVAGLAVAMAAVQVSGLDESQPTTTIVVAPVPTLVEMVPTSKTIRGEPMPQCYLLEGGWVAFKGPEPAKGSRYLLDNKLDAWRSPVVRRALRVTDGYEATDSDEFTATKGQRLGALATEESAEAQGWQLVIDPKTWRTGNVPKDYVANT